MRFWRKLEIQDGRPRLHAPKNDDVISTSYDISNSICVRQKVIKDFRKSLEDFRRLPNIAEDYPNTSEDFQNLAKAAEDEPNSFDRFQKDCEHFRKSPKGRPFESFNKSVNFFVLLLIISNHTVFFVQFGVNLH